MRFITQRAEPMIFLLVYLLFKQERVWVVVSPKNKYTRTHMMNFSKVRYLFCTHFCFIWAHVRWQREVRPRLRLVFCECVDSFDACPEGDQFMSSNIWLLNLHFRFFVWSSVRPAWGSNEDASRGWALFTLAVKHWQIRMHVDASAEWSSLSTQAIRSRFLLLSYTGS